MAYTEVYGYSDDLVEVEGELNEEFSAYEEPCHLAFSDGTLIDVRYNDRSSGIWSIEVQKIGDLLLKAEVYYKEEDEYSDKLHFDKGLKWVKRLKL